MAPTDYPQNLFHSGAAKPLTLAVALSVPASGDVTMTVTGNAAAQGWPAIPNGQKMVVTVGRGTQYEAKYLLSSVSSGQDTSTLTVLAADRNYDGTTPVDSPAGTTVEHTVSATEMATVNDHMRTKLAHGSDGQLVDQNSTQTLSNKTLNASTLNDPIVDGARFTPVGTIVMWPSNTIPEGFLACNGQTITAQAYPELHAIIGGTVPNLTDKFVKAGPVNLTAQGAATRTLSEENMPAHKHDVAVGASQPAHSHAVDVVPAGSHSHSVSGTANNPTGGYTYVRPNAKNNMQGGGAQPTLEQSLDMQLAPHTHPVTGTAAAVGDHDHSVTVGTATPAISTTVTEVSKGSGAPLNIEPAHIVLQYIICAKPQGA